MAPPGFGFQISKLEEIGTLVCESKTQNRRIWNREIKISKPKRQAPSFSIVFQTEIPSI